jgi:hypothetical protein
MTLGDMLISTAKYVWSRYLYWIVFRGRQYQISRASSWVLKIRNAIP